MKRLKEEKEERVEKVKVPGVTYYNYLKGKEEFDKSKENLEKQQEEARKNADKNEVEFVALLNKAIKDSGLDLEMQLKESLGVYEYNIKDRKELSKVLESLDKANIKASIKRGVVEGYRYLLQVKAPITEAKEENPAKKKGLRSTRIKAEKGKGLKEGYIDWNSFSIERDGEQDNAYIVIPSKREGYGIDQVEGETCTVEELIDFLGDYDKNTKVVIGNDKQGYGWYTYGPINKIYKVDVKDVKEDEDEYDDDYDESKKSCKKGKCLKEGSFFRADLFDLSQGNGKEYWTSVFEKALHTIRDDYKELITNKSDEELRKIAEGCAETTIKHPVGLKEDLEETLYYAISNLEESCKGKKCKKQLKESWESDDIIEDLIERACSIIDDGEDDLDEAIFKAVDEGLFKTHDQFVILKEIFDINDLYTKDGESVWSAINEYAFDMMYGKVSDYFEEKNQEDEDDVDYDRRAVEKEYNLEDGELDGVSIRDAEELVGEEEGALDRFIKDEDIDESKKQECKKKVLEALKNRTFKKGLKESQSQDDKYVIYKENGKIKGTTKSNYDAKVRDANKINSYDKFSSTDDVINYLIKNTNNKDKNNYIVVDESLKESKKLREGQEHTFRFSLGLDVWALVDVEAENYDEAVEKVKALSEEELVQGNDTMIKSASVVGDYDLDWEEPVDDDDDFEDDDYDESLNEGKKKTRLSDEDKNILKSIGYKEEDFKQIEEFMNHMEYRINDKKSSIEEVKEVLDIKDFLSGVARATFHWTTGSEGKNGEDVDFDASRWWRHILKDESLKEKYKGKKSCKKALKESNGYGKEYYEVEEEDFYEDMLKDFSWEDEVEYQFPPLTKEDLKRIYNYNLEVLGKLKGDDKEEQDVLVAGKLEDLVKYADEVLGYALHPDFVYHRGDFDTEDLLECNVKEEIEPVTKEDGIRESKLNEVLVTKLQKFVDKVNEELPDDVKETEEKLEASTSKAEDFAILSVFWNKVMDHAFDNWEDQDIHVLVDDSEAMIPMPESVHKQFVNLLFEDKIKNIDVLSDLDIYDDLLTTGDVGLDDGEYERLYNELVNNVYFEETEEDKEYEPSAEDDIEYNGELDKVEVIEEKPAEKPAEEKPVVDSEKELEIKKVLEDRNTFEFESGDYCYIEYKDGKLIAGGATNAGIMPDVEVDYDFDESVDANLDKLYNAVLEKHPEYSDF